LFGTPFAFPAAVPRTPRRLLVDLGSTNHCSWRSHNFSRVLEDDDAKRFFLALLQPLVPPAEPLQLGELSEIPLPRDELPPLEPPLPNEEPAVVPVVPPVVALVGSVTGVKQQAVQPRLMATIVARLSTEGQHRARDEPEASPRRPALTGP
jgi:hypothetical protein